METRPQHLSSLATATLLQQEVIDRIAKHIRRLSNARRFGVPFVRRRSFRLPTTVKIGERTMEVARPDERGAEIDFLTCFIEDEYGLRQANGRLQTILDIGANIGFFSMAARSYYPDATIHAYEPNPRILPYTIQNAAGASFRLFPEAVGATVGLVSVTDTADSNQVRTSAADENGEGILQVAFQTVVDRLGGSIDLAKIDCEGAEWELFRDPAPWSRIRHLRMEYHLWQKHTFSELNELLTTLDYTILHHRSSGEWGTVWCCKH